VTAGDLFFTSRIAASRLIMTRLFCTLLPALLAGCLDPAATTVAEAKLARGQHFFDVAFPHTNGRSCATCHVAADHFALSPAHVAATAPDDVLFDRIDADDPAAATPTFAHLRAGLVRVTLRLADNLDVIDAAGNVVTNADRTIWVWRGVPTVENVAYTAPYQLDGRAANLEDQALGALRAHSAIDPDPDPDKLSQIAAFERTVFSSAATAELAAALAAGEPPPPLDLQLAPDTAAGRGQAVFAATCGQCHGSATTNSVADQLVFDSFFPVQHGDGTIDIAGFLPTGVAIPATFMQGVSREHEGTLGISAITMLGQIGRFPNPSGLTFPHYRIRFYTDASRTQPLVDMPPAPPGIGPALIPEPFSVDPGRAIVSGDPIDWEGFDVPQLRGLARTAPYFHDNSAPTLKVLVDIYSRFLLPADPVLGLPPIFPPEGPGLPPESLGPAQKADLLAFLELL
jgi:cytochrome c peroxidase